MFSGLLLSMLTSCSEDINNPDPPSPVDPAEKYSGGGTTTFIFSSQAFSNPAANLVNTSLSKHLVGDLNFEQSFVKAPAPLNSGLGPFLIMFHALIVILQMEEADLHLAMKHLKRC